VHYAWKVSSSLFPRSVAHLCVGLLHARNLLAAVVETTARRGTGNRAWTAHKTQWSTQCTWSKSERQAWLNGRRRSELRFLDNSAVASFRKSTLGFSEISTIPLITASASLMIADGAKSRIRFASPTRCCSSPPRIIPLDVWHHRVGNNNGQERLLFQQAGTSGVYHPETLKSMRLAFDLAWTCVSSIFKNPETARQILAVQILHHADRGEHKVGGLATAATDDLFTLAGVRDRHHQWTGDPRGKENINRDFAHFRTLRQI
jgi:hypothetical protein